MHQLAKIYSDPQHWVRGNKAREGARTDKLIHMGVGHALTNWEHVEAGAMMLFGSFVDSVSIAATRAYGTINGAKAREAALREAADTFFSLRKALNKKDRKIVAEIEGLEQCARTLLHNYGLACSRRNDIAHGVAKELSFKQRSELSWFLVAPNYQSRRTTNWIDDDVKLREAKGLRLSDEKARFDFNKFYYKNADYVFDTNHLKVFAGKFAFFTPRCCRSVTRSTQTSSASPRIHSTIWQSI
jgi:hypothetical protein